MYDFFYYFWVYNPACTQTRLDAAVTKGYITADEEKKIIATSRQI